VAKRALLAMGLWPWPWRRALHEVKVDVGWRSDVTLEHCIVHRVNFVVILGLQMQ
jgi:hypothetical protein